MPKRSPVFRAPQLGSRQQQKRDFNARREQDPQYQARRELYASAAWRSLRLAKLTNRPLCEHCLKEGRLTPAVHVDHIIPMSAGGDPLPPLDQLMSLCASCHSRKTAVEKQGGTRIPIKGCDEHGIPLDPMHPWRQAREA